MVKDVSINPDQAANNDSLETIECKLNEQDNLNIQQIIYELQRQKEELNSV